MMSSLPLASNDFDRPTLLRAIFQESLQVLAFNHSLLLDLVCGTTYLSAYMILNF